MQVCTSLQTDHHASTPPVSSFTGRMPFLPPNQQYQGTEDKQTTRRMHEIFNKKTKVWMQDIGTNNTFSQIL